MIYTLVHYGTSYATWRTPFHQLLEYGSGETRTAGISSGDVPQPVPMSTVNRHNYATASEAPAAPVQATVPAPAAAPATTQPAV